MRKAANRDQEMEIFMQKKSHKTEFGFTLDLLYGRGRHELTIGDGITLVTADKRDLSAPKAIEGLDL